LDGDNRRSLYVEVRRNFLDPFLLAFDFPMPSTSVGDRNQSNVPAQALGLLNDPLVREMSQRWARRTESITEAQKRIEAMLKTAYGRPATDPEVKRCLVFVDGGDAESWTELAHVLMNSKEFAYLR
jgi:hypothetical protein